MSRHDDEQKVGAEAAAEYRQRAAASRERSRESFERCDTDGFLSQWASDINARLYDLKALVAEQGGKSSFPHLHTLDGRPVKAKVIKGRFGLCWALLDEQDKFTGTFVSYSLTERGLKKKGFQMLDVEMPARAKIAGGGQGMAGAASCYATIVSTVDYPEGAVVV
jgi:hypothetical protein